MIGFTNRIKHNLPVKILALLASFMLWVFVMNEDNPEVNATFTVPITTVNAPNDDYEIDIKPGTVKIVVRADRNAIAKLTADSIGAYVDLSGAKGGNNQLRIRLNLPPGIKLVELSEESVSVILDEIETKLVPIEIKLQGNPAANFVVNKVTQNHKRAKIRGPKSSLDMVTSMVGYVPLNGNKESFTIEVPINPVTETGNSPKDVKCDMDTIMVEISIDNGMKKKMVTVKPAVEGHVKTGYTMGTVRSDPAQIEIVGTAEAVDKVDSVSTVAFSVDGRDASWRMDANVILPDGVTSTKNKVVLSADVKPNGQ